MLPEKLFRTSVGVRKRSSKANFRFTVGRRLQGGRGFVTRRDCFVTRMTNEGTQALAVAIEAGARHLKEL